MKLLCVGDVCGSIGCEKLCRTLPCLRRDRGIDTVIVNGENSADGNGISAVSAESIFSAGADVITGGNHSFRRKESAALLEENDFILRPDNLPGELPGKGYCLLDKGRYSVAVINLLGTAFLDKAEPSNPFVRADELIDRAQKDAARFIVVDFHAEATGEKRALGYYLDGRISVFFGTHTHVQTADEQILPQGTGYLTDIGMTGPADSVLGVKKEIIIDRMKNGGMGRFELAEGECRMEACLYCLDDRSGKTESVERIRI